MLKNADSVLGAMSQGKEKLMAEGHIKWYDDKKGYGFISSETHGDVFLHRSGIKKFGHFGFQKDDEVTFEIKETPKGIQAVDVEPVKTI